VLVKASRKSKAYYNSLRKEHNLIRTDGDEISWIFRSVAPLPPAYDGKPSDYYSNGATAIRHTIRVSIPPDQIVRKGFPNGCGLSAWACAERERRKREKAGFGNGPGRSRGFQSLADVKRRYFKGKAFRVVMELGWSPETKRARIYRVHELPEISNARERRARWKRIEKATKRVRP
jgi:hypothetical protein